MPNDDFLQEVSDIVSGVQAPAPIDPIVPEATKTPQTTTAKEFNQGDLVDSLIGEKKRETLTVKDKEEKKEEKKNEQVNDKTASLEKKEEDKDDKKSQTQKRSPAFMDRFFTENEAGDLLLADGSVLVKSGNARAVLEGLKKEARDQRTSNQELAISNIQLGQKFKELYTDFKALQEAKGGGIISLVKDTGMSEQEVKEAISLMTAYKKDPLSAIKSLLTQAHANGIDISSLGVKTSLDIPTLVRMLKGSEAPAKETAVEPSEEELLQRAHKEVEDFLKKYPDAQNHSETIAAVKKRFPQATLEEIWIRFTAWQSQQDEIAEQEKAKNQKPITSVVKKQEKSTNPRDYSRMSFADIAQTIIEDQ